jgi:hypothetical protein
VERQKPRVVEICSDDDSLFTPRHVEKLGVGGSSQADLVGVDSVMTGGSQSLTVRGVTGMSTRNFNRSAR